MLRRGLLRCLPEVAGRPRGTAVRLHGATPILRLAQRGCMIVVNTKKYWIYHQDRSLPLPPAKPGKFTDRLPNASYAHKHREILAFFRAS